MADEPKTYGKFVDIAELIASNMIRFQGQFVAKWKALITEERWKTLRPIPLTRELVLTFVQDMAKYFRDLISAAKSEKLRNLWILDSHYFLGEIHELAVRLGVDVKVEEIDIA
ncbi:MAG: hypothetical protein WCT37_04995 [Patescibacteria group bacterium]|jgi:hypothetical protein